MRQYILQFEGYESLNHIRTTTVIINFTTPPSVQFSITKLTTARVSHEQEAYIYSKRISKEWNLLQMELVEVNLLLLDQTL